MQVAEIISDLTSLRACDHSGAMALVNVHRTVSEPNNEQQAGAGAGAAGQRADVTDDSGPNPDLQRAKDLLELHREVKLRHHHYYDAGGLNEELSRIRQDVDRVTSDLELQKGKGK